MQKQSLLITAHTAVTICSIDYGPNTQAHTFIDKYYIEDALNIENKKQNWITNVSWTRHGRSSHRYTHLALLLIVFFWLWFVCVCFFCFLQPFYSFLFELALLCSKYWPDFISYISSIVKMVKNAAITKNGFCYHNLVITDLFRIRLWLSAIPIFLLLFLQLLRKFGVAIYKPTAFSTTISHSQIKHLCVFII